MTSSTDLNREMRPPSGSAQDVLDGFSHPVVVGELRLEMSAAFRRHAIEADFALGLGDTPLGRDPAFDKHLLQRWIKQALFHRQNFA